MAEKPKMKYHVVTGRNPSTSGTLLRPVICDRDIMGIDAVVEYALNAGYVRGQFQDMRGALLGFVEAIKVLGQSGRDVTLSGWLRIHGELTGQVGEERTLTSENAFVVRASVLDELKRSIDDFSWENVDDSSVRVKIDTVLTPGGKAGEWKKNGQLLLTGKNLQFNATYGDKMQISYEGLSTPIRITPTENDYAHQLYAWASALDDIEVGTILTVKLTSRGGIEGDPDQVLTRYVKLVAAS